MCDLYLNVFCQDDLARNTQKHKHTQTKYLRININTHKYYLTHKHYFKMFINTHILLKHTHKPPKHTHTLNT